MQVQKTTGSARAPSGVAALPRNIKGVSSPKRQILDHFEKKSFARKILVCHFPENNLCQSFARKKQRQQAGQVRVLIARIEGIQVLHCVWWSGRECFRNVKKCIFEAIFS